MCMRKCGIVDRVEMNEYEMTMFCLGLDLRPG